MARPGLAVLALLAVPAAPETAATGQCLTHFQYMRPGPSDAEFQQHLWRDGVALLRVEPPPETFLDVGIGITDALLHPLGIRRRNMSTGDGISINPTNDSSLVAPERLMYRSHHLLAPADRSVQGPHQEGVTANRGNRKVLAFLCEEPAEEDGGTALFDMQRAWELLPADLQDQLRRSFFIFRQHDGKLHKVPTVVKHEITGSPCLQFFCFGRASRDCVDVYREWTGRYDVHPDPYGYEMHREADLLILDESGRARPFIGLDLYRLLTTVYETMVPHRWTRGDLLIVDNVRWAHARLDGSGPNRKVHFFFYGPPDWSFSLMKLERP